MDKKTVNENVLKVIKSELVHKDKFSSNLIEDCRATKKLLESTCLASDIHNIQGFVQEINEDPFGLILFSEIEVIKSYIFY